MKRKAPALCSIGIDRRALDGFGCDYPVELIHGCAHAFLAGLAFRGTELVCSDPCRRPAGRSGGTATTTPKPTILLEKTTRKTGANSGLAPSRTDKDERRKGASGKGPKPNLQTGDNLRKTVIEETVAVEACGADGVEAVDRERRTTSSSRSSSAASTPRSRSAGPGGGFPRPCPDRCSTASICRPSSSTCRSPKCCPCAGPSRWCRRSPGSGSPRPPASATSGACMTRCTPGRHRRAAGTPGGFQPDTIECVDFCISCSRIFR